MKKHKRLAIKDTIFTHVQNNSKEYIIVTLIFIIGLFLGVMFINNISESQMTEVSSYLTNFIEKLKNTENLKIGTMLKTTIIRKHCVSNYPVVFGTTVIRNTHSFWNCII